MPAGKTLAVVALLAISSCSKPVAEEQMVKKISEDKLQLSDEAIKNLKLETVRRDEFPEKLSLMGRISVPEDRTAVVPSRVSGRTDRIFVASGELVREGQPLCTIFSADFAIAREEFLDALRQVHASPGDHEAQHLLQLSRRKLDALGVGTADVEKWGTGAPVLTGELRDEKPEELTVRAPRAGALLGKNAVIGSLVNVGDTLFMIGDLSKVWFAGDVYPEDLMKVRKNQEVVIDPGNGAPPLHGRVSFISPVVDPVTRTIKIRALMENPGGSLRADMYLQGNVIIQTRVAVVAPSSALVRLNDSVFSFRRLPGNVFQKVAVTTDGQSGGSVSVSRGLNDGDQVVSEGGLLLDAALNGAGS